ncbi:MAG: hypothetical protein WBY94_11655 [Polyangiaceae bacterium]
MSAVLPASDDHSVHLVVSDWLLEDDALASLLKAKRICTTEASHQDARVVAELASYCRHCCPIDERQLQVRDDHIKYAPTAQRGNRIMTGCECLDFLAILPKERRHGG